MYYISRLSMGINEGFSADDIAHFFSSRPWAARPWTAHADDIVWVGRRGKYLTPSESDFRQGYRQLRNELRLYVRNLQRPSKMRGSP